jgi:hypothetical protein
MEQKGSRFVHHRGVHGFSMEIDPAVIFFVVVKSCIGSSWVRDSVYANRKIEFPNLGGL